MKVSWTRYSVAVNGSVLYSAAAGPLTEHVADMAAIYRDINPRAVVTVERASYTANVRKSELRPGMTRVTS